MSPEHETFLNDHYKRLAADERRAEEYNRRMGIEPDEDDEDESDDDE